MIIHKRKRIDKEYWRAKCGVLVSDYDKLSYLWAFVTCKKCLELKKQKEK